MTSARVRAEATRDAELERPGLRERSELRALREPAAAEPKEATTTLAKPSRPEPVSQAAEASSLRVWAALLTVYIVWGSTYLAIRFALETLPPMLMAGTRFVIAGALLYPWMRLHGAARPTAREWRSAALVGALLLAGGNGGVVWAQQTVPSGLAALLVATVPFWMVGLHWASRDGSRPSGGVLVGLAVGLAGVAWLADPFGGASERLVPLGGAAILLLASLSWSVGSLLSRRVALPGSQRLGTAMEMLAGGAILLLLGLAIGEGPRVDLDAISLRSALALLYLIVFGSLIAFSAYTWLLRATTPARVSTYAFVNPAVAVFLGWLLAGEALTARVVAGGALILVAVALITLPRGSLQRAGRALRRRNGARRRLETG